jgi:hypothetical protein
MLVTAKAHFDQDIVRSRALHTHSAGMAAGVLKDDVLRAAWMMAVGASDAYFSDAYADLISRALRAKELQPAIGIPDRLNNLLMPNPSLKLTRYGRLCKPGPRQSYYKARSAPVVLSSRTGLTKPASAGSLARTLVSRKTFAISSLDPGATPNSRTRMFGRRLGRPCPWNRATSFLNRAGREAATAMAARASMSSRGSSTCFPSAEI